MEQMIGEQVFVLPTIEQEGIAFWGQQAAVSQTEEAWSVISRVFQAFWFESTAAYWLSSARYWEQYGDEGVEVLECLDQMIDSLASAAERWTAVMTGLEWCANK